MSEFYNKNMINKHKEIQKFSLLFSLCIIITALLLLIFYYKE